MDEYKRHSFIPSERKTKSEKKRGRKNLEGGGEERQRESFFIARQSNESTIPSSSEHEKRTVIALK
jgi:hypothetical protein